MRRRLSLLFVAAALVVPISARAQSDDKLSNLLPKVILSEIVLAGSVDPGQPHQGHFTLATPTNGVIQPLSRNGEEGARTIAAVYNFNGALRSQLVNTPLGSSTGGFTYTYDEKLGSYVRRSPSFGPAFTERSATIGKGRRSFGFNYQHSSFDTFGGEDLSDRSITFYLPHTDCCGGAAPAPPSALNPGMEGNLVEAGLQLKATTDTFVMFGSYGLTDRWDVGLAVPITRVDLEANVLARIIRLSTGQTSTVHVFDGGQSEKTFVEADAATGIGDVVLRSKYNFLNRGTTGISLALDLRLPTGDEENLLGIGTTQAKILFVLSSGNDRVSPHVNLGYNISGKGNREALVVGGVSLAAPLGVSDEFHYAGGVEFVVNPRLTLIGDFLGRTLIDAGTVEAAVRTYPFFPTAVAVPPGTTPSNSTTNPLTNQPYRQLELTPGNLNLALGAVGAKFNAFPNVLITGNVLFPLTDAGLRDRYTLVFGMDFGF